MSSRSSPGGLLGVTGGTDGRAAAAAFLISDIQSSTLLWEAEPAGMLDDLVDHDRIVREAIGADLGWAFCEAGDSFAAVFPTATLALACAAASIITRQRGMPGRAALGRCGYPSRG